MARNRHNIRGFTLVEIVLVLMVIAICAAIAAPKLADFARGRVLPNAATALCTTARWCRQQAISDGMPYRLNLDPNTGTYWVTRDDGLGNGFQQVTSDFGERTTLPAGIGMSSEHLPTNEDGIYINFWPGGQTDPASIALSSDRRTLNVACETPLGSFRVVDAVTKELAQ